MATISALQKSCEHALCVEKLKDELEVINEALPGRQIDLFEQSQIVAQLRRRIESSMDFPCPCEQPACLKEKIVHLHEMASSNNKIAQELFAMTFRIDFMCRTVHPSIFSKTKRHITFFRNDLDRIIEESSFQKHGMNKGNRASVDAIQKKLQDLLVLCCDTLEPIPDCYGNVPEPFTYPEDMLEV